jgi:hypothetical protein
VIVLENIIINYDTNEPPILNDVHIENGKVKFIDQKEQLKNLEETIDGSPATHYDPQKNISY